MMNEILLGALLVAALSGIGYLLKRWLQGDKKREAIRNYRELLSLQREMDEQGVSVSDLVSLEESIIRIKWQVLRTKEDRIADDLRNDSGPVPDFQTQTEMNIYAYESYERALQKMKEIQDDLMERLEKDEKNLLSKSQAAWRKSAELQAEFSAKKIEGGTMESLIRASELERSAIERSAFLQDELEIKKLEQGD